MTVTGNKCVGLTSESGSPPSFAGEAIKVLLLGESIGETDVVSHQANNKGNPDERNKNIKSL